MKRLLTLLALVLCSCAETFVGEEIARPNNENLPDLTASFADEDTTRTYVENNKYLRWHEDDRLTAFYGNTLNRQYKFNGATGDNSGTFSLVPSGELGTGNAFDHIYALYPYNADARISDEGVISLTLPAVQNYAENSFGLGANTMVAVTENLEDTFLAFKNVGGYLKLKLYNAEGATIKSIEVKGNSGERLAGAATATIAFGEAPVLAMADDATISVTLDCGEGVALGTTAETATEFWFVLPATTFAEGLTITATDTEGKAFKKSTTKEVIIERNAIQPMAILEAKFVATKPANNEIWYTATSKITPNYIGATIKSHTFDGATGHGVITFNTNITNISANAFANCYDLTGITLPESITSIGDYAFDVCYWLTNMTIPNSVTKIGRGVFQNCLRLENITLSNNITSIQEGTFANCEALTSVTIPASVTAIDKAAFTGCYALAAFDSKFASEDKRCVVIDGTLCAFAPAELTSYTLPNNVTSIAVVLYSEILESITIPESVRSIGSAAFYNCYNMTVIYCNVVTPPTLATYTFPEKTTTIYVPAQSVTAYKSASGWSTYESRIRGYDFEKGEVVPDVLKPANNEIWYTNDSTTEATTPYKTNAFGANIVSNTYDAEKECWIITFDGEVTTIGDLAFYECGSLTSITIGDSVTSINQEAFSGCSSLTSVTIPDGVTTIGGAAFDRCYSLTSVTIPDSVTTIRDKAFDRCYSLTSVTIPDSVTTIGREAFSSCSSLREFNGKYASEDGRCLIMDGTLISFAPAGLTEYAIPNSVTTIGDYAFAYCSSLTSVTITDSVTTIRYEAFSGCSRLTSVYITDLSAWCKIDFKSSYENPLNLYLNNKLVTDLVIPSDVTEIKNYALRNCSSLTSVTIPDSVTTIGNDAFRGCSSLTSVTIGDGVTTLGDYAFRDCTNLTSVAIGDSVTTIGSNAFWGCSSLTSVTIPDSVTTIGWGAFAHCSSLTSVYCKATTPHAGGSIMFYDCSSDLKIYVPVESVEAYKSALYWSDYADSIVGYDFEKGEVVPEVLKPANNEIWYTNGSTTEPTTPHKTNMFGANIVSNTYDAEKVCWIITFDGEVTTIGGSAFYCCSSLTSVTIPDSVTTIGNYAFYNCSSLTSITIPDSVTTIGIYAFWKCSSLTSVYCKAVTPPTAYLNDSRVWYAFNYNDSNRKIYVPMESVEAYKSAEWWSDYKSSIVGYNF